MDCGDFAQHLSLGCWIIVLGHGIAARDAPRTVLLDQSMDEEPPITRDQHDVAWNDAFTRFALDAKKIARPDRWQHAGSESLKADRATRSENFGCEIEFVTVATVGRDWHGLGIYEVFRLNRH